jgi:hypothetical protein
MSLDDKLRFDLKQVASWDRENKAKFQKQVSKPVKNTQYSSEDHIQSRDRAAERRKKESFETHDIDVDKEEDDEFDPVIQPLQDESEESSDESDNEESVHDNQLTKQQNSSLALDIIQKDLSRFENTKGLDFDLLNKVRSAETQPTKQTENTIIFDQDDTNDLDDLLFDNELRRANIKTHSKMAENIKLLLFPSKETTTSTTGQAYQLLSSSLPNPSSTNTASSSSLVLQNILQTHETNLKQQQKLGNKFKRTILVFDPIHSTQTPSSTSAASTLTSHTSSSSSSSTRLPRIIIRSHKQVGNSFWDIHSHTNSVTKNQQQSKYWWQEQCLQCKLPRSILGAIAYAFSVENIVKKQELQRKKQEAEQQRLEQLQLEEERNHQVTLLQKKKAWSIYDELPSITTEDNKIETSTSHVRTVSQLTATTTKPPPVFLGLDDLYGDLSTNQNPLPQGKQSSPKSSSSASQLKSQIDYIPAVVFSDDEEATAKSTTKVGWDIFHHAKNTKLTSATSATTSSSLSATFPLANLPDPTQTKKQKRKATDSSMNDMEDVFAGIYDATLLSTIKPQSKEEPIQSQKEKKKKKKKDAAANQGAVFGLTKGQDHDDRMDIDMDMAYDSEDYDQLVSSGKKMMTGGGSKKHKKK